MVFILLEKQGDDPHLVLTAVALGCDLRHGRRRREVVDDGPPHVELLEPLRELRHRHVFVRLQRVRPVLLQTAAWCVMEPESSKLSWYNTSVRQIDHVMLHM